MAHGEVRRQKLTRLLAYVLRHGAPQLGLEGKGGWFELDQVLAVLRKRPFWADLSRSEVLDLVQEPGSTRFEFAGDRLRASYGHSLPDISPGHQTEPPALLFHTTRAMFLPAIRAHGLVPSGRRFVHMTSSLEYAHSLKAKHDSENFPGAILGVQAELAVLAGLIFLQASTDVWTVSTVPPEFLTLLVFDESTADVFRQTSILNSTNRSADPLESLLADSDCSR